MRAERGRERERERWAQKQTDPKEYFLTLENERGG